MLRQFMELSVAFVAVLLVQGHTAEIVSICNVHL